MRSFATIAAIAVLSTYSQAWSAGTCGSAGVKDDLETQGLDLVKTPIRNIFRSENESIAFYEQELRQYPNDRLLMSKRKAQTGLEAIKYIQDSEYDISVSEFYQTGNNYDVAHCAARMKFSLPDGSYYSENISYDVVNTEDGKILVQTKGDFGLTVGGIAQGLFQVVDEEFLKRDAE